MSLSKVFHTLLAPFVEKYRTETNIKGKSNVVKDAADAVSKSRDMLEDGVDLPKDLRAVNISLFCNPLH
jgi:hypothetical protein